MRKSDCGKIRGCLPDSTNFLSTFLEVANEEEFQNHWLQRFKWLAYSDIDISQGAFCKTCVIFSTKAVCGKGSHQSLKSLESSPFTNRKDAIEVFKNHSSTRYYQDCTMKAQNFLEIREGKIASIIMQLDSQAKLRTIVETIIIYGQDIPLGVESDGGRLTLHEPEKEILELCFVSKQMEMPKI
ncbi:hypothetical protein PR048_017650 [Dryococelus australis]|uniref:Uncharacterized protein n=1 Tax=Dryococelus australis TaxID=614101 RepID=A0ABQ9HA35_9NEOP|nr:hypothetical protein PR048_017650 [Dryococelus australis]